MGDVGGMLICAGLISPVLSRISSKFSREPEVLLNGLSKILVTILEFTA